MNIIRYPLQTEKAIRLMETENKLIFVVERLAKKPEIKKAIEERFKVKILKVRTHVIGSEKRAIVTLSPENPARDISTELGLM